jgi:hypothetical protein
MGGTFLPGPVSHRLWTQNLDGSQRTLLAEPASSTGTFIRGLQFDAGEGKLKVTGDLTLHGVTKPVVLDVTVNKLGEHPMAKKPAAGFNATTKVLRSDFGLGGYVPAVGDEVTISIASEFLKAE